MTEYRCNECSMLVDDNGMSVADVEGPCPGCITNAIVSPGATIGRMLPVGSTSTGRWMARGKPTIPDPHRARRKLLI